MTKKDNIKYLYSQIEDKKDFIENIANEFGKEPLSVRTHWFSSFFSVPKNLVNKVIVYMQNYIRQQNLKTVE